MAEVRFPWYHRRFLHPPLVDTSLWAALAPEEARPAARTAKSFRKVAAQIKTSQRLSSGITASIKGRLLAKAELPEGVEEQVTRVLDWTLPCSRGAGGQEGGRQVPEEEEGEEEEEQDEEEEVEEGRRNPYTEFLEAVGDQGSEEGVGVAGGLRSWLGFAGSMTGSSALGGQEARVGHSHLHHHTLLAWPHRSPPDSLAEVGQGRGGRDDQEGGGEHGADRWGRWSWWLIGSNPPSEIFSEPFSEPFPNLHGE